MIDALKTRLAAHKGRWPTLAEESEVPISTLRKVAQGAVKNPRITTVDNLMRTLDRWDTDGAPQ